MTLPLRALAGPIRKPGQLLGQRVLARCAGRDCVLYQRSAVAGLCGLPRGTVSAFHGFAASAACSRGAAWQTTVLVPGA